MVQEIHKDVYEVVRMPYMKLSNATYYSMSIILFILMLFAAYLFELPAPYIFTTDTNNILFQQRAALVLY